MCLSNIQEFRNYLDPLTRDEHHFNEENRNNHVKTTDIYENFKNSTLRNEVNQGLNHISFRPMRLNEVVFVILDAWKQIWDLLDF